MAVRHPFPGARIGYTFREHRADGRLGGDDYVVGPNLPFVSPCAGTAVRVSRSEVEIRYDGSTVFGLRELKSLTGKFPRRVKANEEIGRTGRRVLRNFRLVTLWPHLDAEVYGVREPFGPHVTPLSSPAGTPGKPILKEGDMIVITDGKRAALTDFRNFQTLSAAEIPVAATIHGSITVSAAGYDVEAGRAGRAAVQERQAAANVVIASLPESAPVELSPAQIAAIGAGVKVDTTSLVDAIRQVPTTAANKIIAWLSRP